MAYDLAVSKDETVNIRIDGKEKDAWRIAARKDGIDSLSAWLTQLARKRMDTLGVEHPAPTNKTQEES